MLLLFSSVLLLIIGIEAESAADKILPWESFLKLGEVKRPFGLELNQSSLVHRHFAIGHLALHSFMYDTAFDAFNLALTIDPTFIEAHIGKIFGCKHPLWSEIDFDCGLQSYDAALLATANNSLSSLQSDLLSAAYLWYSNVSSVNYGEDLFLSAIANLTQTYPNETDILVWYGLSLLNVAKQTVFQSYTEPPPMLQGREILKQALTQEPYHPGTLHYLIHAYDVAQSDIAEQGRPYAILYTNIGETASHAQHMASHIWMRIGAWSFALVSDATTIRVSLGLCVTRITNSIQYVNSTQLEPVLSQMNNSNQTLALLRCDTVNRAHSSDWLAYTRMQVGDLEGSRALISDLFLAHNRSTAIVSQYLPYAYLARTRMLVDLFNWVPYSEQFMTMAQQLYMLDDWQSLVMLGNDMSDWFPGWSEAAYRLGDTLRILITVHITNFTMVDELPQVDNHLLRLETLSNQTSTLSEFVSTSIFLMINQIRAIRYFVNGSFESCLSELNKATEKEGTLVPDDNSPYLIFIRSPELLALHLLLIYQNEQNAQDQRYAFTMDPIYNTTYSIGDLPAVALIHYQNSSYFAPNRTINILGLARSNAYLAKYAEAGRFYKLIRDRMLSANVTDNAVLQEAIDFLNQHPNIVNRGFKNMIETILLFISFYFALFVFRHDNI